MPFHFHQLLRSEWLRTPTHLHWLHLLFIIINLPFCAKRFAILTYAGIIVNVVSFFSRLLFNTATDYTFALCCAHKLSNCSKPISRPFKRASKHLLFGLLRFSWRLFAFHPFKRTCKHCLWMNFQ